MRSASKSRRRLREPLLTIVSSSFLSELGLIDILSDTTMSVGQTCMLFVVWVRETLRKRELIARKQGTFVPIPALNN